MSIRTLFKPELFNTEDFNKAISDCSKIYDFLEKNKILLSKFNGNKSLDRELLIKDLMIDELNYEYQKENIFLCESNYRVDFYKDISNHTGVLVEVEGGGTINNNRATLDWEKTQACNKASFLINVVPESTIPTILRRYSYKFRNPEYYDKRVNGLFIIGY